MQRQLNIWKKSSVFCLIACCSLLSNAFGQGLVDDSVEKAALLALYTSTNGANWNLSEANKWTVDRINGFPDSTLYGVEVENGDIYSIVLNNANLVGSLPAELNNLTSLEYLSLSNNQLNGQIPDLGNLVNLVELSLRSHAFTGTLPASISNLVKLETLDLYTGKSNSLNAALPSTISQLTVLRYLNLQGCNLSAANAIPSSFSDLDNLDALYLNGTKLTPNSISEGALNGLLKLRLLNLSSNSTLKDSNGKLFDVFSNLPNLQYLHIEFMSLKGIPENYALLPKLNSLYMHGSLFSDTTDLANTINVLKNVSTLSSLYLQHSQINNFPANIGELDNVSNLNLVSNDFSNSSILGILSKMDNLSQLSLIDCKLTSLPNSFSSCYQLKTLSLGTNPGLNLIPEIIKDIPALENLYLDNCNIKQLPDWFGSGNMNSLRTLSLPNNKILEFPFPESFYSMTELTILYLNNNNLIGALPQEFAVFEKLVFLFLGYNKLTSPFPELLNVGYLGINNNNFDKLPILSLNSANSDLYCQNNKLTFSEIVKQNSVEDAFVYSPQDSVDTHRIHQGHLGGTAFLQASIDREVEGCVYQWYRLMNNTQTTLPQAGPEISIPITTQEEMDAYYFYTITHPNYPQLTLTSRLQTLSEHYCPENTIDFSEFVYDCSVRFSPLTELLSNYDILDYTWTFGDGRSSKEKAPLHAYGEEGTFTVNLTVNYSSDSCGAQSASKQKQVSFNESEALEYKDSTLQVISYQLPQVLAGSASTFSDAWPLPVANAMLASKNEFENGTRGVWRNEGSHVYMVDRQQSGNVDLQRDGTFLYDQFNWAEAEWEGIPDWIKANTITHYNGEGYEVENRDVLGIYTSAIYDYEGYLPTANGLNMRQEEMAFTSFETINANTSGNWVLGNEATSGREEYSVTGSGHGALVKAPVSVFSGLGHVSLKAHYVTFDFPNFIINTVYHSSDTIICRSTVEDKPEESFLVLKKAPVGLWVGTVSIDKSAQGNSKANIDYSFAHSGKASMKVDAIGGEGGNGTEDAVYRQELLQLDSGKSYLLSAWVSEKVYNSPTPFLSNGIGIEVVLRDRNDNIRGTYFIQPQGQIIEGWQQVKGLFTVPGNYIKAELRFKKGQANAVWYDDLRLHPERGNMKTYVYNTEDYRLQAVLDEENYASYYYYDKEGNLFLVKKETEEGIKTLSESITHQKIGN